MRRPVLLWLIVAVVSPVAAAADPVVLYTNLGANGAYDSSVFYALEDDVTKEYAMPFSPSISGNLAEIKLPLAISGFGEDRIAGAELSFTLTTASLAEGGPAGEIIERWTLQGPEVDALVGTEVLILESRTAAMLSGGANYFLSGRLLSSRFAAWYHSLDATGFVFERIDGGFHEESGGGWQTIGRSRLAAFEVSGSESAPVPEPATVALVGGGLAAAAFRRSRRVRC